MTQRLPPGTEGAFLVLRVLHVVAVIHKQQCACQRNAERESVWRYGVPRAG